MFQNVINKRIVIVFLLSALYVTGWSQTGRLRNDYKKGIYLSSGIGISWLTAEIPYNLSQGIREFSNRPGMSLNAGLSKYLNENIEIGARLSFSMLNGEAPGPSAFSATGIHSAMKDLNDEPIIYKNRLPGSNVFIRYYFLNNSKRTSNFHIAPFFGAGLGYISYVSELKYKNQNEDQIIFGKAVGRYKKNNMSNAVYFLQPGVRASLSSRLEFFALLNINLVNYDFLDVVHNYRSDGNRLELFGLYSELIVGVSVKLEKSMVPFMKKSGNRGTNDYLPFSR